MAFTVRPEERMGTVNPKQHDIIREAMRTVCVTWKRREANKKPFAFAYAVAMEALDLADGTREESAG